MTTARTLALLLAAAACAAGDIADAGVGAEAAPWPMVRSHVAQDGAIEARIDAVLAPENRRRLHASAVAQVRSGHILQEAGTGRWTELAVPRSCFAGLRVDLARVATPFAAYSAGRQGLTVADIRIAILATPPSCSRP